MCDKCGVEVTRSVVRRERMGHIKLASPVSHIWFLRGVPSRVGLALGMSVSDLERVVYFSGYVVMEVDEKAKERSLEQLEREFSIKKKEIVEDVSNASEQQERLEEITQMYNSTKEALVGLKPQVILSEVNYFNLSSQFGQVFSAGIGAGAIRKLLEMKNIDKEISKIEEIISDGKETAEKRKMIQRLKFYQGMKNAGIKLEWMLPTAIPVIPPDLRPMVALDGGRFATSDLNDLYRRIINRNNRLKKLVELGAPEVITRNEKRMLQEAVDALFDNSARRGQASVAASTGQRRALRSLADILKGKQGRFRQNLLGKRVDYSGRSVIVVGPQLKLHQAGLPKKMALELFKPFIIHKLIDREYAHNVRTAGRMVDAEAEEAYEILDEIIEHHFVLLNRAPTLHRLSIQAFQPVLIEGKAIQVHPMVCSAFNADFDGDQMAVHVPLTVPARKESANIMLSSKNLLKPASGEPITIPSLDMVLGNYYLTHICPESRGEGKIFSDAKEAILAYEQNVVAVNAGISVLIDGTLTKTSVGRILFNEILPKEMPFINQELTKKELKKITGEIIEHLGQDVAAVFIDKVKDLGFSAVSRSGISWGMDDLTVPEKKKDILREGDEKVAVIRSQYEMGLLTNEERKSRVIEIWNEAKGKIADEVRESLDKEGPVYSMVYSKARGSESVVVQMAGMKGMVADPTGETIELPIKSSFKEGFNVLEYFSSTHGARKGMADTALRTSTAGYLTRRLVDVSQDVIVRLEDCGDSEGAYLYREDSDRIGQSFASRVYGRFAASKITHPETKETLVKKGLMITQEQAQRIEDLGSLMPKVHIRSLVSCKASSGVCQKCYGLDLGRGSVVAMGQAVGTVAAQAIGEPGTQLTMRTFHIGGLAGSDITQGLPRVEEIVEARPPKGEAVIVEEDCVVADITEEGEKTVKIVVETQEKKKIEQKEYTVLKGSNVRVSKGDLLGKGSPLTDGHIDLHKLYETMGQEEVHRYIVREIQEIYAAQGEGINDKHIEVVIRQMLSRIRVIDPGDTSLLPGDIVEKGFFNESNRFVQGKKGVLAIGEQLIMGITKVALSTESFLSAASFQETARVLINAAVTGKEDRLHGLKENVIIGRLIPAGTGFRGE